MPSSPNALQPGPYSYADPIGGPPQLLQVRDDAGELVAVFPATGDDEGAEIPFADLSGEFAPAE